LSVIGFLFSKKSLTVVTQISVHYILSFSNEGYGRATSLSNIKEKIAGVKNAPPYKTPVPDEYYYHGNTTLPPARKANAAFVILGAPTSSLHQTIYLYIIQLAIVT
jgi:hypothetical protein